MGHSDLDPAVHEWRPWNAGQNVGPILDQVRAGLAQSFLAESSLTVAEIAEILQFSETSALTRAMRRWCGQSPRQYRARQVRAR